MLRRPNFACRVCSHVEQGHKRWESDVESAYSKLIDAFHENLLPAIERCSIVTSALRGLARYHESNEKFNVDPENFTQVLEILRSLRLIVHESLNYAAEERRQFLAFTTWLRFQIDYQQNSHDSDEALEQQAGIDYRRVLTYIEGELHNPRLAFFWETGDLDENREDMDSTSKDVAEYIEKIREKKTVPDNSEIHFTLFVVRLRRCIKVATGEIGTWQQEMAAVSGGLVLEDNGEFLASDMIMVPEVRPCLPIT